MKIDWNSCFEKLPTPHRIVLFQSIDREEVLCGYYVIRRDLEGKPIGSFWNEFDPSDYHERQIESVLVRRWSYLPLVKDTI